MHTSNSVYNINKLEIKCNCVKGLGINIQCTAALILRLLKRLSCAKG